MGKEVNINIIILRGRVCVTLTVDNDDAFLWCETSL